MVDLLGWSGDQEVQHDSIGRANDQKLTTNGTL